MTSKTLDFTSWYELQAESDSDEENRGPSRRSSSYGRSSLGQYHSSRESWYEPLHMTLDQSAGHRSGHGSLIQQLLAEMDDANQKIDLYVDGKGNSKPHGQSDEGMSLQEFPIDPSSRLGETDESGCDEAVSSAIAEVSKDFISGNLSTGPLVSGESDDSHISSDNDLRHRRGAAYARYPETAAGLSDSDWNPYVTESDTNTSPRAAIADGQSAPTPSVAADSKLASLMSSFNPPFSSTRAGLSGGKISKGSLYGSELRTATDNTLQLSHIREKTEMSMDSLAPLKPDSSISPPQMSSSKLSEYSFGKRSFESCDISASNTSREEAARSLRKCFERTSWPPSPGRSGSEKSSRDAADKQESGQKMDSGVDSASIEEKFRMLGNIGGLPQYPPISQKDSVQLPGKGYFSAAVHNAMSSGESKTKSQLTGSVELYSPAQRSKSAAVLPKSAADPVAHSDDTDAPGRSALDRLSGDSDLTSFTSSSLDTVVSSTSRPQKEPSASGHGYHEKLDHQVQKLLQETAFLTGSSRVKEREQPHRPSDGGPGKGESKTGEVKTSHPNKDQATNLDYDRLHRDLQEIQDSLHTMGQPAVSTPPPAGSHKTDSDNDGDIVPSTTTTPERERGRRLVWDYAADLGYRHDDIMHLEGMMSDTTETSPINPSEKLHYTSDGEETRTSGSSVREQGEEEEHHDDSGSLTLTGPQMAAAATGGEVDLEELISTFRNESRALESRYQAVRSQGLADKVFGILTDSNPDQQAQGILSEVTAEEQRQRQAQLTQVPTHGYSSSYSESSPSNSLPKFKGGDDVRKRLDLSTLSDSADASHLQASILDASGKFTTGQDVGFTATSTAQTLISAQMKKMADRTFNHSIELRSPVRQVVECYPVYSSQRDQPQYQQLQQELQSRLPQQQRQQQQPQAGQQQRKEESGEAPTQPKEAWPEERQGAVSQLKDGSGDRSKSPKEGDSGGSSAEEKAHVVETERKDIEGQESPGSATSPADSDKSSEKRRLRPYRPLGSQDVYYTESDTASVADSVTTVESTHTGSDDAVAPHFPSSALGSRNVQEESSGTVTTGVYSKRAKVSTAVGSGGDPPLPTIQERSTPDQGRQSSEGDDLTPTSASAGSQGPIGSRDTSGLNVAGNIRASGRSAEEVPVTSVMVKHQARVEDILKQRDAARRVGAPDSSREGLHRELLERTKGEEMLEAYRTQKLGGKYSSPDGRQQSRIPVRGPPPDYQTALRSTRLDQNPGQPSLQEELAKATRQNHGSGAGQPDRPADNSKEAHLLQMIDAQVAQEISERQNTSPENSDSSSKQQPSGAVTSGSRSVDPAHQQREVQRSATNRGRDEPLAGADVPSTTRPGGKTIAQQGWEAYAGWIDPDGEREVAEGVADKRREEAEIKRRNRQRNQEAALQMLEGEQEVEDAVADKRREEAELEQRRHEAQMMREREVLQARKLAEARREAEQRREEAARREIEMRQEEMARREAEIRREARERREAQIRREEEEDRAVEMRREEAARREAEAREAAQRENEAMKREVELAREMALRGKMTQEAKRQREAEEAIARAGGMSNGNSNDNHAKSAEMVDDRELLQRGYEILEQQEQERMLDQQPVSHRAQLLREALEQEEAYRGHADLQRLWERFIGSFNTTEQESTFGSDQLNALADLLRDPTRHLVHTYLHQQESQHEEDRQRAAAQLEAARHEARQSMESQRSSEEERAALERELRREEARRMQRGQSSEEESNGSYGEILQQRERDRLKRREVRTQKKKQGKSPSPASSPTKASQRSKQSTSLRSAPGQDTQETLYSIPEDLSFDTTPLKSRSPARAHGGGRRKTDVIDPTLSKLRQRISQQREKIGQERAKEVRREQKLMKLKALLSAKHAGLLSNTVIAAHLASISSTSGPSSDNSAAADSQNTLTASTVSDETTAKDSSTDMRYAKLARSPARRFRDERQAHYPGRGKDFSLEVDDFGLLIGDSSSQTDSDLTPTNDGPLLRTREGLGGRTRKRVSSSRQLPKHGGKSMKLHQMYSPYTRAEQLYTPTKMRRDRRPMSAWDEIPYSRTRDASTMYPSPKRPDFGHQRRRHGGRLISQGVQTSPSRMSPFRDDYPAIPVPTVERGRGMHRRRRESPVRDDSALPQRFVRQQPFAGSVSPAFDSSGVAACLSPDRDRPRSYSSSPPRERHGRRSPSPPSQRYPSPVELRFQAWAERKQRSPLRALRDSGLPFRGQRRVRGDDAENRPPGRQQRRPAARSQSMSWFIPLTDSKPWRAPLKERQPRTAPESLRQPQVAPEERWRGLTRDDLLQNMEEDTERKAARFYLDRSTKELETELGKQYDIFEEKPLERMSLQEALLTQRPDFVSNLRQRQKRLQLSSENRKLQALVRAEQDKIFMNQPRVNFNLDSHPYSGNLHQPKRRVITKQEMKELTEKKYKHLPEVKQKEILERRSEEYRLNRLRAKVFNKRVQRRVLEKATSRAR